MTVRETRKSRRPTRAAPVDPACSDSELIALVERCEPLALQELYRRHAPWLFAVACRAWGAPLAESLIAALFLHMWTRPESFATVRGSLRRALLARMMSPAAATATATVPPPEERVWALLTVGRCTFAEAAEVLVVPEPEVRRYALAAFRVHSTGGRVVGP